jgi:hypothetical protein
LATERRLPATGDRAWASLASSPLTVATVLLVALTVHTVLADRVASPWIMIDELVYSDLARSFAHGHGLAIRGEQTWVYGLLYPILIAPAWLAHSIARSYELAKAINVVLVTSAGIPLYIWARRLVPPGWALLVLGLFLLLPAQLYAGTLMTENAFLPAFMLAALAFGLALERPTPARQAFALGAILLASTVRVQGLVLVPILLTAIAAMRSRLLARRFWPTFAALASVGLVYGLVNIARSKPLSQVLGAYHPVADVHYSATGAAIWVIRHFAELGVSVALLPVCALLVMIGLAGSASLAERAFLAVAGASLLWLPIQSGVFASRFAHRVEERTMLYVQPLLLLALALWLARGLPRPRFLTPIALVAPIALLFSLPLTRLLGHDALSDTFGLVPLLALRMHSGMGAVYAVFWGSAALALAAFALPRDVASACVPAVVAALLALSTAVDQQQIARESHAVKAAEKAGAEESWVDQAIGPGARATFLFTPQLDAQATWQSEFWNRSIEKVLAVGATEPGGLPGVPGRLDRRTGRLAGARASYVVAPATYVVAGTVVAGNGPWLLYRANSPLRLVSVAEGVAPDVWMGSSATYTVYDGPGRAPARVKVLLSRKAWGGPDVPGHVRVAVGGVVRRGVIHSLEVLRFVLPVPPRPFRVHVTVRPTFSPHDFGLPDQRHLGARPVFRLLYR